MRRWRGRLYLRHGRTGARRRGAAAHEAGAARHPRAADLCGRAGLVAVLASVPFWPLAARSASPRLPRWPPRPSLLMLWRKRSLAPALYSVASWCFNAAGLVLRAAAPRAVPREAPFPAASCASRRRRWNPATSTSHDPWSPLHLHRLSVDAGRRRHVQGGRLPDPVAGARIPAATPRNCGRWTRAVGAARRGRRCGCCSRRWRRSLRGRMQGRLAGVHVNMAERLSLLRKRRSSIVMCRALGVPVVLHLHAAQLRAFLPGAARSPMRPFALGVFIARQRCGARQCQRGFRGRRSCACPRIASKS